MQICSRLQVYVVKQASGLSYPTLCVNDIAACDPSLTEDLCLHQVPASRQKAHAEAQLTLPKWEFGRANERGTVKAVRNMPTLKSHHLNNLTLSDGTLRSGTVQHRDLPPPHYLVRPACASMLNILPSQAAVWHIDPGLKAQRCRACDLCSRRFAGGSRCA